jgi:hypothetical protein
MFWLQGIDNKGVASKVFQTNGLWAKFLSEWESPGMGRGIFLIPITSIADGVELKCQLDLV